MQYFFLSLSALWTIGPAFPQFGHSCAVPFVACAEAVTLNNPLEASGITDIPSLLAAILAIVQIIAIPIVVLFIIYAGFLYVTASGKPDQIATAHRAVLYALIGAVLIVGATVLIEVVNQTVAQFNQ